MPIFDYECASCKQQFEEVLRVSECDNDQYCPKCGFKGDKVITLGHGGIIRTGDSVPWVREAALTLTESDSDNPSRDIETVQDLRNYYEAHPNVRPVESHPALPSKYGDSLDKLKSKKHDDKQKLVARSRKGHEILRKKRSISVNSCAGSAN